MNFQIFWGFEGLRALPGTFQTRARLRAVCPWFVEGAARSPVAHSKGAGGAGGATSEHRNAAARRSPPPRLTVIAGHGDWVVELVSAVAASAPARFGLGAQTRDVCAPSCGVDRVCRDASERRREKHRPRWLPMSRGRPRRTCWKRALARRTCQMHVCWAPPATRANMRRAAAPGGNCPRRPPGADCTSRNLVDPASSHMLVSKIKPCMSQFK